MKGKNKDLCYTIGIIVAISLALCAFLRSGRVREGVSKIKSNFDNSPPWIIDVDEDSKNMQFIYQGNLKGSGKRIVAMKLTTDGNLSVNRGFSFIRPVDQSWQIAPDKNNTLTMASKAGSGMKMHYSDGALLPLKYGKVGSPVDFSKLCTQSDGTKNIYAGSCSNK